MKIFLAIIFLIVIVSLQITILSRLSFFGAIPNIVLASAIALALVQREERFDWLVFILAACFDFLIGWPFGLILLSIWLAFSVTKWLGKFVFRQSNFVSLAALSLIGALLYQLFLLTFSELALLFKYSNFSFLTKDLYTTTPIVIILNTLLCLLVYGVFKKTSPLAAVFNRRFIWSRRKF